MSAQETLPPAVLRRAHALRAVEVERDALVAERDALREAVKDAGWERDEAQGEAAALRDDVLGSWAERHPAWRDAMTPEVGRLYVSGDDEPARPEDGRSDVALVSLATGQAYVRRDSFGRAEWVRYGVGGALHDWSAMAEQCPLVSVDAFAYRDHGDIVAREQRTRQATYDSPSAHVWPEPARESVEAIRALGAQAFTTREPAEWITRWRNLASRMLVVWQDERRRAERAEARLAEVLALDYDAEASRYGS